VVADSPNHGVVDSQHRVFGYRNMYICDGSVIAANLGVNPSLTIAALAERAMSFIPPAAESQWNDAPPVHVWIADQNPHILKKSGGT
jgi:cholesterol oxidase